MGKLRGLLDSANETIGGLLGDFPEGFNRSAVAGFPGWTGDIAYMGDMVRRYASGRPQIAAQDFPGTTDYFAAQSGYPIPQTLSGQLGAMLGGFVSPSPGDVAKLGMLGGKILGGLGPALAAIPFWHGSPHKYDVADLSKIGTGEGAQAYGYGLYGSDIRAPDTANTYRSMLAPFPRLRNSKDEEYVAKTHAEMLAEARVAGAGSADKALKNSMVRNDVVPITGDGNGSVSPEERDILSAISSIKEGGFRPEQGGYLYRGEYRWPDPTVEAKTPLTEADMLDWDKPLSEQSPKVRAALENMPELRDSQLLADGEKLRDSITGKEIYSILTNRNGWSASNPDSVGSAMAPVSEALKQAGIPGIKYQDAMSRGSEGGTHNYVFFSDEGIHLLERNGEDISAANEFARKRAGKGSAYKEYVSTQ